MRIDYALILTLASAIFGLIWLVDAIFWAPKRKNALENLKQASKGEPAPEAVEAVSKPPLIADYARSLFPIVFIILIIRSFLYEPFRIPSGSMLPTLWIGDFILVDKFSYGIRLPVLNTKVIEVGKPERGDIVVFRFPHDIRQDYIKRVVGLPGDEVIYHKGQIRINPACQQSSGSACQPFTVPQELVDPEGFEYKGETYALFREQLGEHLHSILYVPSQAQRPSQISRSYRVPEGHYLVLGDNRDRSADSRSWGFLPADLVVGKAVAIWFHFDHKDWDMELGRIGGIE